MKKKYLLLLLCFFFIRIGAMAQVSISGIVTDDKGITLPGVNVSVIGTKTGALTGEDGTYLIQNVPNSNSILVFSYVGFKTQEIKVGKSKTINVKMMEDLKSLNEVVVIGYGTARKRDLSGAISSVKYSDSPITQLANPNALVALGSKVSGFDYAPTNSAGGDNTGTMTIRGKGTIPTSPSSTVNEPLIIVDGTIFYGSIAEIATTDIATIDVLKDASAAAIYGSRSANGVIIITTKKGTSNKPSVDLSTNYGFSSWARKPQMITNKTAFLNRRHAALVENGTISSDSSVDPAAILSATEYEAYKAGIWTNWIDEISQDAPYQNYNLSISGKSGDQVNYYISSGYMNQKGIMKGNDYSKYTIMAKIDTRINPWLTIGVKGNYLGAKNSGVTSSMQAATWMTPFSFKNVRLNGYTNWIEKYPDGVYVNPLWGTDGSSYLWTDNQGRNFNINGIGYVLVDFPFLKGLSYKFTLNAQRNSSESDTFTNPQFWINTQKESEMANPYMYSENAHGTSAFVHSASWNVDNIFTYNKNFEKHHIDLIAGYTREATNIETLKSVYSDFDTTTALGTYGQDLAGTQKTARLRTESQSVAYLARINYNYYNRYYFTFNFRHDGYSAFAKGNKWANFPGVSAAWIISQENFMKGIKGVDFLKVRLSYGQNGSRGVSPYSTIAAMSKTYTVFGSDSYIAMHPSSLANKSLTWATTGKWNIGFDFSVLSNRLNGSIDFYKSVTTHMLLTRSLPYLAGFSSSLSNAGQVNNKGVEFSLNSINMGGNGNNSFRWESNIVFSLNRNKVVKLFGKDINGNEANDVANAITYGYQSAYALVIGKSITSAWDYKKLGVFQSQDEIDNYKSADGTVIQPDAKPGDIKFEDYNKDGKINSSGDRHWIGDQDPLFTVNLGNTLTYKNFSLYFNFRWNAGNNKHYLGSDPYGNYHATGIINGAQLKAEPWSDSHHTNTYSRLGYTNPYAYYFWRRRDFLKLKDISLSYTVDQSLLKSIDIQSMRIFLSGTDLFTLTGWSGLDPENGGTIAAGPSSTTYGSLGTFKTISMGVNITF